MLHAALEAVGIAETGPLPPFVSNLSVERFESIKRVAQALAAQSLGFTANVQHPLAGGVDATDS